MEALDALVAGDQASDIVDEVQPDPEGPAAPEEDTFYCMKPKEVLKERANAYFKVACPRHLEDPLTVKGGDNPFQKPGFPQAGDFIEHFVQFIIFNPHRAPRFPAKEWTCDQCKLKGGITLNGRDYSKTMCTYGMGTVRSAGHAQLVEAMECQFTARGGIATSILTCARALLLENNMGMSGVCNAIRSQMFIMAEQKRLNIKNFLNYKLQKAPWKALDIKKVAKELEPIMGTASDPLLPLPSFTWLKQVVALVDEEVLKFQESVLATVDAGDELGIVAFDHTFKHSGRIKAQQGRGTVEAAFGATANVFNCKGEPLLSLLVESKSMDELEEPLSQLRSNISARGGYQPKVLYVDDISQVNIFQEKWPELVIKQDHLHAMMRVSRELPGKHSQAIIFQGDLCQCITRPCRSDGAFKVAADALKRDADKCTGMEPGFRAAFQKANGRYETPSPPEQAKRVQELREKWAKLHELGKTYCSEVDAHLWSEKVDGELKKLAEMAQAGYLEDPYPVGDMYYVDSQCKVRSRRGTSALENYHKGQHKSIVGMKVGPALAHRSLVNFQYRTLLAARAKSCGYKDYPTSNQMLLLQSNRASGSLFQIAFTGLSEPLHPLTTGHFVGGIKCKSAVRIEEEKAAAVAAEEAAKAAEKAEAAAQIALFSSMAAEVPAAEDAGDATMDSLVEQQTNFNSPSKRTPLRARRKSTEGVIEAVAAEQSGKRKKNSSGGASLAGPSSAETSPTSSKKRSKHASSRVPLFNYAPLNPGSEKVKAKFDVVLQKYEAGTKKKTMDYKELSLQWNAMVEQERIDDPQTELLPTNEKMIGVYHKERWRTPVARTMAFNPQPAPAPSAAAIFADGAGPSSAPSASFADSSYIKKAITAGKKVVQTTQQTIFQSFKVTTSSGASAAPAPVLLEPPKRKQGGAGQIKYCRGCAWNPGNEKLVHATHQHKKFCPNIERLKSEDMSEEKKTKFVKILLEKLEKERLEKLESGSTMD
ncbi:hypothetical protein Ndes2437A_g04875 [Nannochloris sp. 'desiccata']